MEFKGLITCRRWFGLASSTRLLARIERLACCSCVLRKLIDLQTSLLEGPSYSDACDNPYHRRGLMNQRSSGRRPG